MTDETHRSLVRAWPRDCSTASVEQIDAWWEEMEHRGAADSATDRLRRAEPYAPTLKNPRRDPLAHAERGLTLALSIVVAVLAALASAVGIVVAGFAFMVAVFGGLELVTSALGALPWELLALAVILALLWRAQGHNVRR